MKKITAGVLTAFLAFPALVGIFDMWAFTRFGHTVSFAAWTDAAVWMAMFMGYIAAVIFGFAGMCGVWDE